MIDPVAATLDAIARHDLARLPLAFAAGALTSIGPCVAPRYVAITAVIARTGRRTPAIALFVGGLLLGYAVLGFGVGLAAALVRHTTALYALLALTLALCGLAVLVRQPHDGSHQRVRASGIFALGAGSALIVSPCCTPIVAAIAGMGAVDGSPATSAALLMTFALGHALPLVLLAATGTLIAGRFVAGDGRTFATTVSGALMLALGAYYGFLA